MTRSLHLQHTLTGQGPSTLAASRETTDLAVTPVLQVGGWGKHENTQPRRALVQAMSAPGRSDRGVMPTT